MKLHCSEISGSAVSKLPGRVNRLIPTLLNASFGSSFASMQLSSRPSNSASLIREIRLLRNHYYFRIASRQRGSLQSDFTRARLLPSQSPLSLCLSSIRFVSRRSRGSGTENFRFRGEKNFLTAKGNFDRKRFVDSSTKKKSAKID